MAQRLGEDISIAGLSQSGEERGDALSAYLAIPPAGHGPGIVVIQEWWGLVDHIRDVCDRLAREGFAALAPDLFRGESTRDPDVAGRLMMDLEIPRAVEDLCFASDALLRHHAVDGSRLAVIGFCMGGQLALAAAAANERIGAVVDCYGVHPRVEVALADISAPVLGIFAENDTFVPPAAARTLESDLKAAGGRAHFNIYPGVSHAFLNESRPDVFDATAAAEAWNDILNFLRAESA